MVSDGKGLGSNLLVFSRSVFVTKFRSFESSRKSKTVIVLSQHDRGKNPPFWAPRIKADRAFARLRAAVRWI